MSDTYLGESIGKLGFGLMRLPKKGLRIDVDQVGQMVDRFLDAGFTYFDTAYVYPGSEAAAKKALVERHPREKYQLATKLNVMLAPTESAAKKQFEKSLERTGAGHFDFYLLHALMNSNVKKYERFKIWEYAQEQKAKGLAKHVGFSFHGGPALLEQLLSEHPEAEFVQLQINYLDWDSDKIASRANYEVARRHNKPIVIMEPVKGGTLARPTPKVRELFERAEPGMSCASWAIRFAASLEGIITVLSGMSNLEQMDDNLSYMRDFQPLTEEERAVIRKAQDILGSAPSIPCTACGYCLAGCPKHIQIPRVFSAANERTRDGQIEQSAKDFAAARNAGGDPADCLKCGKCEKACPQHIPIIHELEGCVKMFGGDGA